MKTIKYTVDHRFRKAGDVRQEEDDVADSLILRGFAEETDDAPDEKTGDGSAIDQYHPEGAEADEQERGGTKPLPAEMNAPGEVGSNAPAPKGSKAKKEAASSEQEPEQSQEPTGDQLRTDPQEAQSQESGGQESGGQESGGQESEAHSEGSPEGNVEDPQVS